MPKDQSQTIIFRFLNRRGVWQTAALFLLFAAVAGYGYAKTRNLINGPELIIDRPKNGEEFEQPLITVNGQGQRINGIALNDGKIFTDETGRFREKLLLAPGHNIIKLEVNDKFGRRLTKYLSVIYRPNENRSENTPEKGQLE